MPQVINSLRGGHTHTHTDLRTETILRNQVRTGHVPGFKIPLYIVLTTMNGVMQTFHMN